MPMSCGTLEGISICLFRSIKIQKVYFPIYLFNFKDLSVGRISSRNQRKYKAKDARSIPALPGSGEEDVAVNLWNFAREDSAPDKETSIIPG